MVQGRGSSGDQEADFFQFILEMWQQNREDRKRKTSKNTNTTAGYMSFRVLLSRKKRTLPMDRIEEERRFGAFAHALACKTLAHIYGLAKARDVRCEPVVPPIQFELPAGRLRQVV